MNRPSHRPHLWSWLPVEFLCGGLLFACGAAGITTAQEDPTASPPESRESGRVSPREATTIRRQPLTLIGQVETPPTERPGPIGRVGDVNTPATKPNTLPEFLPRLSTHEQKILDALDQNTQVAFTDTPLEEALNFIRKHHHFKVWMDQISLQEMNVRSDVQVSLAITDISVRSVLQLLLEPRGLTYVIEDEVLKIMSQVSANRSSLTRTYPVGDLFETREDSLELVQSLACGLGLPNQLENEQQIKSLAISVPSGAIIARLSRPQHDQLLQLLRDLREAKSLVPDRSADLIERLRVRIRQGDASSSPTPLDEFSPGSESETPTPRFQVPEKTELTPPPEAPAPSKTKMGR